MIFFISPVALASYIIKGISGEILKNVQVRLELLEKQDKLQLHEINHQIKKNVRSAMQPYGYFTPKVSIQGNRINIDKGLSSYIKTIQLTIVGPGKYVFTKLPYKLPIEVGAIFENKNYVQAKQQLFDIAEHHGYLSAKMTYSRATVNPKNHTVSIHLIFDTGRRYFFAKTIFSNKTFYSKKFLHRYLSYHQGQPFDNNKLLKLTEDLNSSSYFESVSVKPNINYQSHRVDVDVNLIDRPSQNYTIGLGYGTDTGVRGRLGWNWLRVTPTGHTFKALFIGSQKQNAFQAQYLIPGNNPVTEQFTISANIFQLAYPIGNSQARQLSLAKIFHHERKQYIFELDYLREKTTYLIKSAQTKNALYPNLSLELKKIDNPLFSKNGLMFKVQGKAASANIGSDLSFAQIQLETKAAIYLPTHTRLVTHGIAGYTDIDNILDLPLSLQLLAGGSDSIRGYQFQSIGPGKHQLVGSSEVQQEFKEDWYFNVFYDAGDVYKPSDFLLKQSVGLGLMWVSPVGPLRIYLAKPLSGSKRSLSIVFSMGPDL